MAFRRSVIATLLPSAIGITLVTGAAGAQERATVPLVEDYVTAAVAQPPDSLGLDPFYAKYVDAHGIPIVTSERVPDAALLLARDIVVFMLADRPDLRREMIRKGRRVGIMAENEVTMDIPEYRDRRKPAPDDRRLTPRERERYNEPGGIGSMTAAEYWNRRGRGYGGNDTERITTGAEENVLGYAGTRYYGENILVHEFSHAIMGAAIRTADPDLYAQIEAAYREAMAAGKYEGHYASTNANEYWAEGVQWYAWSNYEWYDGETRLWSPEDLKAYDPRLFELIGRVIPGHRIPGDVYHGSNLRPARNE